MRVENQTKLESEKTRLFAPKPQQKNTVQKFYLCISALEKTFTFYDTTRTVRYCRESKGGVGVWGGGEGVWGVCVGGGVNL